MGIRVYKPTTNGRRNMTSLDFAESQQALLKIIACCIEEQGWS